MLLYLQIHTFLYNPSSLYSLSKFLFPGISTSSITDFSIMRLFSDMFSFSGQVQNHKFHVTVPKITDHFQTIFPSVSSGTYYYSVSWYYLYRKKKQNKNGGMKNDKHSNRQYKLQSNGKL